MFHVLIVYYLYEIQFQYDCFVFAKFCQLNIINLATSAQLLCQNLCDLVIECNCQMHHQMSTVIISIPTVRQSLYDSYLTLRSDLWNFI